MKKFISALSSLVIAATAMGGALAFSSDAAEAPDSTIVAFRSDGKSEITAKAGETVKVNVYVPQSQGFNTLSVKMAINGDETLGKGVAYDMKNNVYENFPGSFGNYGIEITEVTWPGGASKSDPCCLDSGIIAGNKMFAGYPKGGQAMFTPDAFNLMYQASHAISYTAAKYGLEAGSKNIDSYSAWEAAGKPAYDGYTPVWTWSKNEEWAYQYPLVSFTLKLPDNLADGTYVLDAYMKEYLNLNPSALFNSETNEKLPESKWTYNEPSGASGIGGANNFKSEALTITVGNPVIPDTTTTTPAPTPDTTTTPKQDADVTTPEPVPAGSTIIYDLKTAKSQNISGAAEGQNKVTVQPGEKFSVQWTVTNDQEISGLQMYFDFSDFIQKGGKYIDSEQGDAYMVIPNFNESLVNISKADKPEDGGQIVYTFGGNEKFKAEDGALIYTFNLQAPEKAGTYSIVLDDRNNSKAVPYAGSAYGIVVHGLDITVGGAEETTTTTTAAPTPVITTTTTAEPTPVTTTTPAPTPGTTTTPAPVGDVLYGDVNCDKEVRINDVVLLNRYLAKTADITPQGKKNADCVNDGNITSDDATAIKEYLARLITELPKK